MLPVNADTMRQLVSIYKGMAGKEQKRIIDGVGAVLQLRLPEYQIDTPLRIAHFLAQCAHESAGFRTLVEFASGVDYNGRRDLGNTQPNDGPRYKGRGLLEITGRLNYRQIGATLGLDLEGNPDLLNTPENALRASCVFWNKHSLNTWADKDDIVNETRIINGGQNGIDSRRAYLSKAKTLLALLSAGAITSDHPEHPVLCRGIKGEDVARVQTILRAAGYKIAIDGDFGPATELAVADVQQEADLDDDGIVGPDTWAILDTMAGDGR